VGADPDVQIERIHRIAFGTSPDDQERQVARETLAQLTQHWKQTLGEAAAQQAADRALNNYCHAILNSAGFVYVD
jgi:hypothetical protein